jgi:hypothetical protein
MRGSRGSLYACCIAGALALGFAAMLAAPLTRPPILESVHAAVRHYDLDALPPLSRFAVLLASFEPPYAGADDELMDAPAYARALSPLGVKVEVLPGLDHMALTYDPVALAAVVAAAKGDAREAAR